MRPVSFVVTVQVVVAPETMARTRTTIHAAVPKAQITISIKKIMRGVRVSVLMHGAVAKCPPARKLAVDTAAVMIRYASPAGIPYPEFGNSKSPPAAALWAPPEIVEVILAAISNNSSTAEHSDVRVPQNPVVRPTYSGISDFEGGGDTGCLGRASESSEDATIVGLPSCCCCELHGSFDSDDPTPCGKKSDLGAVATKTCFTK